MAIIKRRWRPSKRRVKARAKMGQWIPRTQIKDYRLQDWAEWETKFDYDVSRVATVPSFGEKVIRYG